MTDLTPSDAMAAAAKRGLELAAAGKGGGGLEPATKARARKIASKGKLTPAHVKRMHSFFSRHAGDKKEGWGKAGSETPGYVAWQLWGGDSGKAWAAAKVKALGNTNMEDESTVDFAELFLADPTVQMDDEGLIWKPMLHEGVWAVGPNGRALKVVAGKSPDPRQVIGMQDIVEAFEDQAVPHVTIPKTHEDKVDENTGFIRKLKIEPHGGIPTLWGGHHFTDKTIEQKVMEGSIANTSVGLEFDYQRKDDAKVFPIALRHNALTNRPWLGRRLAPFGMQASEKQYDVLSLQFSEPLKEGDENVDLWDGALTYAEIREAIVELTDAKVHDIAHDRALLSKDEKGYVAKFSIDDGEVVVEDAQNWVERDISLDDTQERETSVPTSTLPIDKSSQEKKTHMTDTDPKNPPAEFDPSKIDWSKVDFSSVDLSEHPQVKAERDKSARLQSQVDQFAADRRTAQADALVTKLKSFGLTEDKGFTKALKLARNIMLSDKGETSLLLAEEGSDTAPVPKTASGLLLDFVVALSEGTDDTGRLKVELSEQQTDPLQTSGGQRPPLDDTQSDFAQLSEEEKQKWEDAAFAEMFPEQAAALKSTTTKEN